MITLTRVLILINIWKFYFLNDVLFLNIDLRMYILINSEANTTLVAEYLSGGVCD